MKRVMLSRRHVLMTSPPVASLRISRSVLTATGACVQTRPHAMDPRNITTLESCCEALITDTGDRAGQQTCGLIAAICVKSLSREFAGWKMAGDKRRNRASIRLAADIGGTFTDIAVFDETSGQLTFGKALSTPHHLVEGISAGVAKAGSDYASARLFLHGSTVAINTILERTGAKTALVTTEGFRDIYEI